MAEKKKLLLGEYLVNEGLITPDQLTEALQEQKKTGELLGKILLRLNFLSEETMARFLSCFFSIDYVELGTIEVPLEIIQLVPEHLARQYSLLPVAKNDDTVILAMKDPQDAFAIDELRRHLGCDIIANITTEKNIKDGLEKYYGAKSKLHDIIADSATDEEEDDGDDEEKPEVPQDYKEDVPTVKLVDQILTDGVNEGVSDVHIEPEEKSVSVRYRLDGILKDIISPPKDMQEMIISRIKVISNLDIAEKRLPQDGRFQRKIGKSKIDVRVSICPTVHGEKVVMRLLNQERISFGLEQLGFAKRELKRFQTLIGHPHGIILVTGPTGSGKTTTLYSALESIKTREKNMMTIEDPVEYRLDGVYQAQVNTKAGLNFATLLRSLVRQDPDIILVGEIRDLETAQIAIRAALTGHLVLSTLHTNSAPATVTRLVDMGIEPFLISSSTIGVMAQRLVRVICSDCKAKTSISEEQAKRLNIPPDSVLYKGEKCSSCRETGFKGRQGIYELMLIDDPIRDLIVEKASLAEIKQAARKGGMRTLREDALERALKGVTTIEEVFRVTEED